MREGGSFVVRAGFVALLILGLLLVAAMYYQLWWKRDFALYHGKSRSEQRALIAERTGMNPRVLLDAGVAARDWGAYAPYEARGESLNRSYVEYLLVPRVPKGGTDYSVVFEGEGACFRVDSYTPRSGEELPSGDNPWGAALSLLAVASVAMLLALVTKTLIGPECVGLAMGLLVMAVWVSRSLSESAHVGMLSYCTIGVLGLLMGGQWLRPALPGRTFVSEYIERHKGATLIGALAVDVLWMALLLSLLLSVVVVPDDWDAWAIWGPKAKVLAMGVGPLSDLTYFGHADYPLLWPAVWALAGWCSGGWEELMSRGWGAVFLGLTAWQLYRIVKRESANVVVALGAAALFVSIPKVLVVSSWSYAEAPLWFMTSLWFGRLLQAWTGGLRDAALAGVFAALVALTKNEGVLIALVGAGWLMVMSRVGRAQSVLAYAVPFVLLYGPWWYWTRVVMDLGDHATEGLVVTGDRLNYALDRLLPALRCLLDIWLDVQQWGAMLGVLLLGALWLLCRGPGWIRAALAIPFFMWLGYFTLVLFHNADVYWQMGTSWDRLTIQGLVPLCCMVAIGLAPHLDWGRDRS